MLFWESIRVEYVLFSIGLNAYPFQLHYTILIFKQYGYGKEVEKRNDK